MPASMMRSLFTGAVLVVAPAVLVAGAPQAAREVVKAAAAPRAPVSLRKPRRLASVASGRFLRVVFMRCLAIPGCLSDVGRPMLVE